MAEAWTVSRTANGINVIDENGLPVCTRVGLDDAKLIAAAPDLLASLEKAVEHYGKPGGPWNVPSEPGTWIADARAAISKAKGEG